jgi:hypothetical protein
MLNLKGNSLSTSYRAHFGSPGLEKISRVSWKILEVFG